MFGQVPPSYGPAMYGQTVQPQPQRSSVADVFGTGDFTTAAQRLQPGKMFDFDMRSYLGSARQQPLPGITAFFSYKLKFHYTDLPEMFYSGCLLRN